MRYLLPKAVFDGNDLVTRLAVRIEEDMITGLTDAARLDPDQPVEAMDTILTPGLFDVQVNGGGGIMLNNDPTPEGVRAIAQAHRSVGTAFILPTVITDRHEVITRAADAVLHEVGQNGVLGIHIEGPHLNRLHKGTHDGGFIRPYDAQTIALLERLRASGLPVLLTVAPEMMPPGAIAALTRTGVAVSGGHSAASAAETVSALNEGLAGFTHLFNAMPPMTSRNPGIVATAINSEAFCGIIADGHHVDDQMVALAFRARPRRRRMVLVSDAMATVAGPDSFDLYGETIRVERGKLVNASGALAGAHIDLKTSLCRLVNEIGISIEDALAAATSSPRELLGLPRQKLVGSPLHEVCFMPWPSADAA